MSPLSQRIAETGKQCYMMVFGLRSGSTLLCDDLRAWGFGTPTEYFQEPLYFFDPRPVRDYVLQSIEESYGDWFGFKINWHQANSLVARLAAEGDCSPNASLWSIFPGLRTIELVRNDKILQAVSGWRASTTHVWHVRAGDVVDPGHPPYDFEGILELFQAVATEEWMWKDRFRQYGVQPCRVEYERYIDDRAGTLRTLAAYLGSPGAEGPIEDYMSVMRDEWSDEVAAQFRLDTHIPNHDYWDIYERQLNEPKPSSTQAA